MHALVLRQWHACTGTEAMACMHWYRHPFPLRVGISAANLPLPRCTIKLGLGQGLFHHDTRVLSRTALALALALAIVPAIAPVMPVALAPTPILGVRLSVPTCLALVRCATYSYAIQVGVFANDSTVYAGSMSAEAAKKAPPG